MREKLSGQDEVRLLTDFVVSSYGEGLQPKETAMVATAATYAEALKIAEALRATFAGCDWIIRIAAPLFEGDLYFITVG